MTDINLRQHKKNKLRENIIDSSLDMFCRRGFDETTIDDITLSLEISKRTFFRYFPTKEDIVLSIYENLIETAKRNNIQTIHSKNPIHTIKHAFCNLAMQYEKENNFYLKIESLINKTPAIRAKRIEKFVQYGEEIYNSYGFTLKKNAEKVFQKNIMIYFSMGIFESAITTWTTSNGKTNLSKIIDDGFKLIDKKLHTS